MATSIHVVPSGSGGNGKAITGTITGVANYPDGQVFDSQAFVDAGISVVELPSDMSPDPNDLIGSYITTTQTAGFHDGTTYADEAAFNSDTTFIPDKFKNLESGYAYNNGFGYVTQDGSSLGEPTSLTITDAGLGYTIGTGIATSTITGSGTLMTVEVTSVGSNGEITGVSVTDAGSSYVVDDTLQVLAGDGAAVLTVSSLKQSKIGEINSGRGKSNQQSANDINPTYFTVPPLGYAAGDLQLFIPSSNQILTYQASSLPAPFEFDSLGNCFVGGDFRVQVRIVATLEVISEYVCPGPQDVNSDIDLSKYTT